MKRFFILLFLLLAFEAKAYQPAVVSANPDASKIGMDILDKGGSAADAAVAMAFALAVTEPYNSGLGGGGFLLYYEAKSKKFYFVDYREVAPGRASSGFYIKDREKIKKGINSVAVPGFVLGMETIHKKWRKISWPAVLDPSIELAKNGIPYRAKLKERIQEHKELLNKDPKAQNIFVKPLEELKYKLIQETLALTLEEIKTGGADVFYRGPISKKITSFMRSQGGLITESDLKNYQVHFRKAEPFKYGPYQITSASLPSSGARALDLLFKKTIVYKTDKLPPFSGIAYTYLLQSFKDYFYFRELALGDTTSNIISHTTHLCVIDSEGNIAAMTNTLNSPFGSGVVVPGTGILLNNEMDDFSLATKTANPIRPGKRPLSSMSPTIVFKNEEPVMVIGTPGGTTIPLNLFQVLFYHWKWDLPLDLAIKQSKIYYSPRDEKVILEGKLANNRNLMDIKNNNSFEIKNSIGNVQVLVIKSKKRTLTYSDPRGEGKGYVGR